MPGPAIVIDYLPMMNRGCGCAVRPEGTDVALGFTGFTGAIGFNGATGTLGASAAAVSNGMGGSPPAT